MPAAAGIVLAGGRSTRMGGVDKPLLELGGEPMLAGILRRLKPQVAQMAINANGGPARFASFGLPVVPDTIDGFEGPLAGIAAGMQWAKAEGTEQLLTVAGDTPFLPADLCRRLAGTAAPGTIAVARSGRRVHPVFAMWPVALAASLADHLAGGGSRKVLDFIGLHHFVEVDFEPLTLPGGEVDPFFNINTPDDLAQARRLLQVTGT